MREDEQRRANWERATTGASRALGRRQPRINRPPRNGALGALWRIRSDVAAGLDRRALLERIDEELYRLKNKKAADPKGSGLT